MFSTYTKLSSKDKSFLRLASVVAEQSRCDTRHGAVVVRGGSVLAIGWNKNKNHPIVFGDGEILCASVHAEMDALRQVKDAKGAIVYVARIKRNGKLGLSKPCPSCREKIDEMGIRRVVHT